MKDLRPDWLSQSQYPFALRSFDLPGGSVTYVDEGNGPALLFVNAGIWSFVFRDVIERLRSTYRCITLDFPGFGLSPAPDRELTPREMSTLLGEFVDALELRDFTIVAHDMGGPVSLVMANHRADRIGGLVLANTFAWTPDSLGLRTIFRIIGGRFMTGFNSVTNLMMRVSATKFGVGRHLDGSGRAAFLGPYRDRARRRRFHRTIRSVFRDPDFTDAAEAAARGALNHLPVLTVFGEKNDPFGFQARLAATFPDHRGVVVAAGNHFPMMDDPDLFAHSVASWHTARVTSGPRTH